MNFFARIHFEGGPPGGGGGGANPLTANSHQVRDNEHIAFIASSHGYASWQTLWDQNTALHSRRANPFILFHGDRPHPQGDVLRMRDREQRQEPGNTENTHRFVVPDPDLVLRLKILDENLQPQANTEYELTVNGAVRRGHTNAAGIIQEPISRSAQTGSLRIIFPPPAAAAPGTAAPGTAPAPGTTPAAPGPAAAPAPGTAAPAGTAAPPPPSEIRFPLFIGRLDPIQERAPDQNCTAGVQARLNNLGFECGIVDGILGDGTHSALRRFQHRTQIAETGNPDAATQTKLHELHDTAVAGPPPLPAPAGAAAPAPAAAAPAPAAPAAPGPAPAPGPAAPGASASGRGSAQTMVAADPLGRS